MDLPNLLNKIKHKDEPPQRFLAVEIGSVAVKSAVWQVVKDETQIVSIGSLEPYDSTVSDDLIKAVDQSLGNASTDLESEPDQVIFGLPETWVSGDSIAAGQKQTIKEITDHLALKPVGFVVITEALVRYLTDSFGGPPSLILLNLSPTEVAVSLVKLGKIEGTQVVRRSQSIVSDVEEGLARFPHQDNLPARFLLFDSREDLDALKQELIAHDWLANLPFLHFPKIESLSSDTSIKAIALSGGAEVARSLGLNASRSVPETDEAQPAPVESAQTAMASSPPSADATTLTDVSAEFGFTSAIKADTPDLVPISSETEPLSDTVVSPETENTLPLESTPPSQPSKLAFLQRLPKPNFTRLKAFFYRIFNFFQTFFTSHRHRLWLWLLLIGILIAVIYAYYFLPQAEVTIYLKPETISQDISFTVSAAASASASGNIAAAKNTYEAQTSLDAPATGTVTIGDKATGKVTIYNRTLSTKTLPKGTILQSQNLKFTLDNEIKIASASTTENSDFSITLEPAKADVGATAVQIGAQSNLPANTKFNVANFSPETIIGNAASAFTGGSSQEVAAVSKSDQATLQAKAEAGLTKQITTDLLAKSSLETKVVSVGKPLVKSADFSAKVGEPADTLKLNLTMSQDYFIFKLADVLSLGNQASLNVPVGMVSLPHLTNIQIKDTSPGDNGEVNVTATVSNVYVPKIDETAVIAHLRGRPPALTQTYLHTLPGYIETQVHLKSGLPAPLGSFPIPASNFLLTTKTQSN